MSERLDIFCGCAYIKAGEQWFQVVACPDHEMDMHPVPYPPKPRVKKVPR